MPARNRIRFQCRLCHRLLVFIAALEYVSCSELLTTTRSSDDISVSWNVNCSGSIIDNAASSLAYNTSTAEQTNHHNDSRCNISSNQQETIFQDYYYDDDNVTKVNNDDEEEKLLMDDTLFESKNDTENVDRPPEEKQQHNLNDNESSSPAPVTGKTTHKHHHHHHLESPTQPGAAASPLGTTTKMTRTMDKTISSSSSIQDHYLVAKLKESNHDNGFISSLLLDQQQLRNKSDRTGNDNEKHFPMSSTTTTTNKLVSSPEFLVGTVVGASIMCAIFSGATFVLPMISFPTLSSFRLASLVPPLSSIRSTFASLTTMIFAAKSPATSLKPPKLVFSNNLLINNVCKALLSLLTVAWVPWLLQKTTQAGILNDNNRPSPFLQRMELLTSIGFFVILQSPILRHFVATYLVPLFWDTIQPWILIEVYKRAWKFVGSIWSSSTSTFLTTFYNTGQKSGNSNHDEKSTLNDAKSVKETMNSIQREREGKDDRGGIDRNDQNWFLTFSNVERVKDYVQSLCMVAIARGMKRQLPKAIEKSINTYASSLWSKIINSK